MIAVQVSTSSDTRVAIKDAGARLAKELDGMADLVLCFTTADAECHRAAVVLDELPNLVGRGDDAVPFAASTSAGLVGMGTNGQGHGGECALVLWAFRDPRGAFAVGGSLPVADRVDEDGRELTPAESAGELAAAEAVAKARRDAELRDAAFGWSRPSWLPCLPAELPCLPSAEDDALLWVFSAPGHEEDVLAGIHRGAPMLDGDRWRLLGSSSADCDPDDGQNFMWQASAERDYPSGVVIVVMKPSIDWACVQSHGFEDVIHSARASDGERLTATITAVSRTENNSRRVIARLKENGADDDAGDEAAAELYNRWTREQQLAQQEADQQDLAVEFGVELSVFQPPIGAIGAQLSELRRADAPKKEIGILEASASFPLRVVSKAGERHKGFEAFCIHPSAVHANGAISVYADVEEGDEVELLSTSGKKLLAQVAVLDELLDRQVSMRSGRRLEEQSMLGSLCYFCAGCKAAVAADPDLRFDSHGRGHGHQDGPRAAGGLPSGGRQISALEGAFSSATRSMPFALLHPFGEQACITKGGKPRHSNLNFGALVFFTPKPQATDAAVRHAEEVIEHERTAHLTTFSFVSREHVLNATRPLPCFQQLQKHSPEAIHKLALTLGGEAPPLSASSSSSSLPSSLARLANVVDRTAAETHCVVSHRWEAPGSPDSDGRQLRAIQAFLRAHPTVGFVWYDYWCLPQDERTSRDDEDTDASFHASSPMRTRDTRTAVELLQFKWQLKNVNLLYMGLKALVLADVAYTSRFWCCFEFYLSMQKLTEKGLRPATDDSGQDAQATVMEARDGGTMELALSEAAQGARVAIMDMSDGTDGRLDLSGLRSMWHKGTTIHKAYRRLVRKDIVVTNQGDKIVQLAKAVQLDRKVKQIMALRA